MTADTWRDVKPVDFVDPWPDSRHLRGEAPRHQSAPPEAATSQQTTLAVTCSPVLAAAVSEADAEPDLDETLINQQETFGEEECNKMDDDYMATLAAETRKFELAFSRERSQQQSLRPGPPSAAPEEGENQLQSRGDGKRDKHGNIHCNSCATVHRYRA
jgi:hypothetical protein